MTLLIKNVKLLGGEKEFPPGTDVFVSGDRVSAIGSFPNKKADEVIDGQGCYLCPGFIDVNTDSDHYLSLLEYPAQEDFLKQGVTTIIGGLCGSSLAPLLYGSLESVQKWADTTRVNVNWHTVEEFLNVVEKRHLAINFGTLAGHATIRRALVGDALRRDLTKNELKVFGETVRRALSEGAFGLSTGLGYVHARHTPYAELKFLAEIVKEHNGVYATHLRNDENSVFSSFEETLQLAKEVGVNTEISHFLPFRGMEHEYETALEKIEALPPEYDFNFDLYPYDKSILALYTFLPLWVQSGGREVMLSNIHDTWLQPKITKDFSEINPSRFVVAEAPGNDALVGKSLRELQDIYSLSDFRETLLKLTLTTDLRAIVFYENINPKLINRAFANARSLVASNAASFSESGARKRLKAERAYSTFTRFLSLVEHEHLMPLETAVKKITWEPKKKLGIEKRGLVQEGYFADLVGFSMGGKNAEIKFVVVNGQSAMKAGVFQNRFAGYVLKHHA